MEKELNVLKAIKKVCQGIPTCVSLLELQTEGRFPNCLFSLYHYRYCVQSWLLESSFVRTQCSWPAPLNGSHELGQRG